MRLLFSFCAVMLISSLTLTAQKSIDKYIDQRLKEKRGHALSLPGWAIKSSSKAVKKFSDDDEVNYWKLAQHVRHFRFLIIEDGMEIDQDELDNSIRNLQVKESFEEYARLDDKETNVSIFAKEENETIKGIVFIVNDKDALVIVRLKTKFPLKQLESLNYSTKKQVFGKTAL